MGVWIETAKNKVEWSWYESHPAWVCGLKRKWTDLNHMRLSVTPCVGVWIETHPLKREFTGMIVTPCVGVWIETCITFRSNLQPIVTPCVGVWIETIEMLIPLKITIVTPCVGVWIETPSTTWRRYLHMVTPCVGVYGLKHCSLVGQVYGRIVSIRPLVYFSSSCYKVKSQTKYVRLLTLL